MESDPNDSQGQASSEQPDLPGLSATELPMSEEVLPSDEARWLDGWGERSIFAGAVIGGPLAAWSSSLIRDHGSEVSGSLFGLGHLGMLERFLGGVLIGGLAGLVLAMLVYVMRSSWRAITSE